MLLKGTIYVTTDVNLCMANLNMCKTIVIADEPDIYNIPGKIGGSLLLPPYEAMTFVIDGDDEKFKQEYLNYLSTHPSVTEFIDIILQALVNGTNMIFLLDPEFDFGPILAEFFLIRYGIILGDSIHSFGFDTQYSIYIMNELYMSDYMKQDQYLTEYPTDGPFDPLILQKLIYDSQMLFDSELSAIQYFRKKALILKNGGLIRGVVTRL